jgi:hypothetical protein
MEDNKRQHLEFVQGIINRMNSNSFQIKSLSITILAALLAIYASTSKVLFIFIGIPPTILFWLLDSYYLQLERRFRGIYNDVSGLKSFVQVNLYEMPIKKYTRKVDKKFSFWNVFFSSTILWLYLSIVIFLLAIGLIIKYNISISKLI